MSKTIVQNMLMFLILLQLMMILLFIIHRYFDPSNNPCKLGYVCSKSSYSTST